MRAEQSSDNNENLVEITSILEESKGFVDLVLSIISKKRADDFIKIVAKGKYRDEIVGLSLTIMDEVPPGFIKNEVNQNPFVRKGVVLKSIGTQSDSFVKILSELYGIYINELFTKENLEFTIFSLNKEKGNLENQVLKFKLFYDDLDEKGLYNEFYLNTNFPKNLVELREKDEEYRENIIKMMTQNSHQ